MRVIEALGKASGLRMDASQACDQQFHQGSCDSQDELSKLLTRLP